MDVIELAIIGIIVVVFVVMGPKKIPELARALGSAKKEFSQGAQDSSSSNYSTPATYSTPPTYSTPMADTPAAQDDLMVAARRLGIPTEGKTREQISAEIVHKTAGA
jgi:sec-independent protein translocase protein TatA